MRRRNYSPVEADISDALLKQAKTDCPVLFGDYLAEMVRKAGKAIQIHAILV